VHGVNLLLLSKVDLVLTSVSPGQLRLQRRDGALHRAHCLVLLRNLRLQLLVHQRQLIDPTMARLVVTEYTRCSHIYKYQVPFFEDLNLF